MLCLPMVSAGSGAQMGNHLAQSRLRIEERSEVKDLCSCGRHIVCCEYQSIIGSVLAFLWLYFASCSQFCRRSKSRYTTVAVKGKPVTVPSSLWTSLGLQAACSTHHFISAIQARLPKITHQTLPLMQPALEFPLQQRQVQEDHGLDFAKPIAHAAVRAGSQKLRE